MIICNCNGNEVGHGSDNDEGSWDEAKHSVWLLLNIGFMSYQHATTNLSALTACLHLFILHQLVIICNYYLHHFYIWLFKYFKAAFLMICLFVMAHKLAWH